MGSISFAPEVLNNSLAETAGYKSGLALSISDICDVLNGTGFDDKVLRSEEHGIRLESTEYEEVFHRLLYGIGYAEKEYTGLNYSQTLHSKYRGTELEAIHNGVLEIHVNMWQNIIQSAIKNNSKSLDPTPFFEECLKQFGTEGAKMAIERIEGMTEDLKNSAYSRLRFTEWDNIESLSSLFEGSRTPPEIGTFIDQRYVNFLQRNQHKLGDMHWRKFEALTAEYFHRQGYEVELGPGSGDDGVDLRVWNKSETAETPPLMIIQCKRQKKRKVEKIVVKGLYADLLDSGADIGLLVTTTELSPGARDTINLRGYPIEEIDGNGVNAWIQELRTPGTGIVRC